MLIKATDVKLAHTLRLSEMITLFMIYLKNKFSLRWESPIFGGTGRQIGLKLEKCLKVPDIYRQYFYFPTLSKHI